MAKFEGNAKLKIPAKPKWATYVPTRSPMFKVHSSEGLARNAFSYHRGNGDMQVLKWNDKDEDWDIETDWIRPDNCPQCQGTMYERGYWRGRVANIYKENGPDYRQPMVCYPCWHKMYEEYNREWREEQEKKKLQELKAKYEGE